jgi:hypothetical protein
LKKTHFEKLAQRNCKEFLCEIYLKTCDQPSNLGVQQNVWIQQAVVWPSTQLIKGTKL